MKTTLRALYLPAIYSYLNTSRVLLECLLEVDPELSEYILSHISSAQWMVPARVIQHDQTRRCPVNCFIPGTRPHTPVCSRHIVCKQTHIMHVHDHTETANYTTGLVPTFVCVPIQRTECYSE